MRHAIINILTMVKKKLHLEILLRRLVQPRYKSKKSTLKSQENRKWKINIVEMWYFKIVKKSKMTKQKIQPMILKPPILKLRRIVN